MPKSFPSNITFIGIRWEDLEVMKAVYISYSWISSIIKYKKLILSISRWWSMKENLCENVLWNIILAAKEEYADLTRILWSYYKVWCGGKKISFQGEIYNYFHTCSQCTGH